MGDSYIGMPVDGAGKKTQTYDNVIGANTVHAEAITAVTTAGVPITIFPVGGTVSVDQGTLNSVYQLGSLYYVTGLGMGTVRVESGTVGVSQGTLNTVSQLGTAYFVSGLGMGTVRIESGTVEVTGALASNPTDGTVGIKSGTLNNVYQIGTVCYVAGIGNGTVQVSGGTIGVTGALASNPTDGTLTSVTQLGTLYNLYGLDHGTLGINQGTLNSVLQLGTCYYITGLGMGTVRVESGTVGISQGTLNNVYQLGTLYAGSVVVTSGTLQMLKAGTVTVSSGTLQMLNAGTVTISSGTLQMLSAGTVNIPMGTLNSIYQLGTLYYLSSFNMGTVRVEYGTVNLAGSGTVNIASGTIAVSGGTFNVQGTVEANITEGTLNELGSANVYSKHDLHDYHALGTYYTDIGTIVQTATKLIKVHHYRASTDGTWAFSFVDNMNGGGTVDFGWLINQREGMITPFVPYPGYLLKTTTAGSALFLGSWPSVPCNGTLRLSLIYTDDDVA